MATGKKMKTNRSAAKRFHLTKNGKIKRERAFLRHLRGSKTTKQKRRLRQQTYISQAEEHRVRRMLAC